MKTLTLLALLLNLACAQNSGFKADGDKSNKEERPTQSKAFPQAADSHEFTQQPPLSTLDQSALPCSPVESTIPWDSVNPSGGYIHFSASRSLTELRTQYPRLQEVRIALDGAQGHPARGTIGDASFENPADGTYPDRDDSTIVASETGWQAWVGYPAPTIMVQQGTLSGFPDPVTFAGRVSQHVTEKGAKIVIIYCADS